ncbi:uncharacterized protein LOC130898243 [Diorhabda carinulata]|uniref:uncharacterized protein LOC130898243 n=1 Tax=Diorhabda carinulata TaxID=1163345 RepID=UPI0025A1C2B7|nr:uncharacterized protein LOC130898243 [Diorhabda carinulata]XP_057663358.1 uncharacterized protein LOC130898243 [Diorhabda carinulata]
MTRYLSLCCFIATCLSEPVTQIPGYPQLKSAHIQNLHNGGFGSTLRNFLPTETSEVTEQLYEEEPNDSEAEPSQDRAAYANQNYPIPIKATHQPFRSALIPNSNYPIPIKASASKYPTVGSEKRIPQKQYLQLGEKLQAINKLEDENEDVEEPDRLSLLLPQSKFSCNDRHTGYYADEGLGCEVFHYCQENSKHSWICPEGFTFHQVHLICMPPGGDNICEKSSDYHFVNDFLYKPVNLEEYQQKPNVTLKYSDRYYPEQYRSKFEEDDTPVHHQHSVRVTGQSQRTNYVSPTTVRPQQVFRSPEEINISLQQRRPIPHVTQQYDEY